ncbi:MAG: ABC transporter ATP-binding protein [Bacilli bacterium]|nr:ABC transporter ATP-binding protein [Bacilli bacterium]
MSSEIIIEANNLTKIYSGKRVVDDVSFTIKRGQIVGLVGKNGAGKTTLMRILIGAIMANEGTFSLFDSHTRPELVLALKRVAAMIETPALYERMNAEDNLKARCMLMGVQKENIDKYIRDLLVFVGLEEVIKTRKAVRNFSLGMRQRVQIAMALVGDPELMILDEPTNGLDPAGILQVRELLLKVNKEKGTTIMVSSHILSELGKFATDYIFLDRGKIVDCLSAEDLEFRVGKVIELKGENIDNIEKALSKEELEISRNGDSLFVKNIVEAKDVINLLVKNGLEVSYFKETENALEDYFVSLLEDKQ